MDNTSSQSILDTLRTVEFRLGLKGYNVDEVDEYLEKAAVEAEQFQERLRAANERVRQATERIAQLEGAQQRAASERAGAPAPAQGTADAPAGAPSGGPEVSDDTLQRTLLLAQKFVDQTKRESEAEAAQLVGRAEERARTLLAHAEQRAGQITAEAEERLRHEVARLEEARSGLEAEVEAMGRSVEEQRAKIRASLTEALRWVDERMQGPPKRGPGDTGGQGGPDVQPVDRAPAGAEGEAGAARTAQAVPAAPVGPERQAPAVAAPERTQSPVGARSGVLNGSLFEAGRDGAKGLEENRLRD